MAAAAHDAFDAYVAALYPFYGSPCLEAYAALIVLLESNDPTAFHSPPPLLPMLLRLVYHDLFAEFAAPPLHHAAADDRVDAVGCALRLQSPLLHATAAEGMTLLHSAAAGAAVGVMELLWDGVRAKDDVRRTALHFAATAKRTAGVDLLLSRGETGMLSCTNIFGTRPLHAAALRGSAATVQRLLDEMPRVHWRDEVLHRTKFGECTLHVAAEDGDMEKLALLLHAVGLPDDRLRRLVTESGATLAHCACRSSSITMIDRCVAIFGGWEKIPQTRDFNGTLMKSVGYTRSPQVFRYVRQHAERLTVDNDDGWTPLHNAAAAGRLRMFEYLRQHEAYDINAVDKDGYTVLHAAATSGKPDFFDHVARLIDDSLLHARTNVGSLTTLCVSSCDLPMLRHVVAKGYAAMSDKLKPGVSLALCAVRTGSAPLLRYVLDNGGGTLDDQDDLGRTVAHFLADSRNPTVVADAEKLRHPAGNDE